MCPQVVRIPFAGLRQNQEIYLHVPRECSTEPVHVVVAKADAAERPVLRASTAMDENLTTHAGVLGRSELPT